MRGPAALPIVIAAGGTGGHFFPAEALAGELLARGRRVALMTDARSGGLQSPVFAGLERFVISGAGIAGRGAVARGQGDGGAGWRRAAGAADPRAHRAPRPWSASAAIPACAPVLADAPDAAAAGGDPARAERRARPRQPLSVARHADRLALSFAATERVPEGSQTVVTGNPVRPAIAALAGTCHTRRPATTIRLLVLGGSLGARVFSDVVPAALASLPDALLSRIAVVQQCRPEDLGRVRAAYDLAGIDAELSAFFPDVAERLAIGASGDRARRASTVAELAVAGRPAILVPLPGAIDDHQSANARALAEAARRIGDRRSATFSPDALARRLAALLADAATCSPAPPLAAREAMARADAGRSGSADLVERSPQCAKDGAGSA